MTTNTNETLESVTKWWANEESAVRALTKLGYHLFEPELWDQRVEAMRRFLHQVGLAVQPNLSKRWSWTSDPSLGLVPGLKSFMRRAEGCTYWHCGYSFMDHSSLWGWSGREAPMVFHTEPYSELSDRALEDLRGVCRVFGMAYSIVPDGGFHYPGSTTSITVYAPGAHNLARGELEVAV